MRQERRYRPRAAQPGSTEWSLRRGRICFPKSRGGVEKEVVSGGAGGGWGRMLVQGMGGERIGTVEDYKGSLLKVS